MAIIYALVANGDGTVLAEHAATKGNTAQVAADCMQVRACVGGARRGVRDWEGRRLLVTRGRGSDVRAHRAPPLRPLLQRDCCAARLPRPLAATPSAARQVLQ
jgi:hypothetical protein